MVRTKLYTSEEQRKQAHKLAMQKYYQSNKEKFQNKTKPDFCITCNKRIYYAGHKESKACIQSRDLTDAEHSYINMACDEAEITPTNMHKIKRRAIELKKQANINSFLINLYPVSFMADYVEFTERMQQVSDSLDELNTKAKEILSEVDALIRKHCTI